ncbi:hypothetical protein H4582DRAFT_2052017 [Lactarius indigo]|nr:hypothetical protein H4582DRAFT_2052017 [Lactarius indigo]
MTLVSRFLYPPALALVLVFLDEAGRLDNEHTKIDNLNDIDDCDRGAAPKLSICSYANSIVSSNFALSSSTTDGSSVPSSVFDHKAHKESRDECLLRPAQEALSRHLCSRDKDLTILAEDGIFVNPSGAKNFLSPIAITYVSDEVVTSMPARHRHITIHARIAGVFPDSFPDGLESDDEVLLRPMVTLDVDELTASQLRDVLCGWELWVDTATLKVPFPQNFDPLNPAHYSPNDPHAEVHGVMAELYLDLAPSLRQLLVDRNRKRSFISSNGQIRCTCAASLLENPGKPSELYPLWPRLLFPNQNTSSTHPFQCMALVKFLKIILYGPSSIDSSGTGNRVAESGPLGCEKDHRGDDCNGSDPPRPVIYKDQGPQWRYLNERFKLFLNQGHGGDVEDLLKRLQQAELSEVTCLSSPPAHVAQPMGAAERRSSTEVQAPVNDQMGQPPKDANTDTKLMADDHELDIAVRRPKRQSKKKQPPLKSFLQTVALLDQALTILGPCENWGSVLMGMNGNEATQELIRLKRDIWSG